MNCDRCKRQLQGTVHTKDDYRVDFYRLWTGNAVPVVFKEEGEAELKFFKIESPSIVTLCDKCASDPKVRDRLKKFESPL
jgi:hypothetical protein